jgi:hypothetical protein
MSRRPLNRYEWVAAVILGLLIVGAVLFIIGWFPGPAVLDGTEAVR